MKEIPTHPELVAELIPLITQAVNLQHLDVSKISSNTALTHHSGSEDSLGLDSVDILEVVVTLEHHYGIKIENSETGKQIFANFGSVADYLLTLLPSSNTKAI